MGILSGIISHGNMAEIVTISTYLGYVGNSIPCFLMYSHLYYILSMLS